VPTRQDSAEPETQEQLTSVNEDLRQSCCKLHAEISDSLWHWLADTEQGMQSEYADSLYYDPVGDQKRSELRDYHERETVRLYRSQYASKMLALTERLSQHGCITPNVRYRLENPTEPQDIEYIVARLGSLCRCSSED